MDDLPSDFSLPDVPLLPYYQDLSSFTVTHPTDSDLDDDDDSDDYFHYDFPQPPPISPALRRMRSSPWHSQQLDAIERSERRHSVSPIIQNPDAWRQSLLQQDTEFPMFNKNKLENNQELAGPVFVARSTSANPNEGTSENNEHSSPLLHRDPYLQRQLPPPAPAPSIPLPRLPRIIRKVASMRSEPKQESSELVMPSRRPIPKIKSLKFMSGSALGSGMQQSCTQTERKRSWSLSRPAIYQKPKIAPYVALNSTNDQLSDLASCNQAPSVYISPAIYSNSCPTGGNVERHSNNITFGPDGRFDLSRGSTTLAPPFSHRTTRSSVNASHRYSNNSCGEGTFSGSGASPGRSGSSISHERSVSGQQHPPLHPFYNVNYGAKERHASSGALLQDAKSFINITPEKRKVRRDRSKSASSSAGLGNGGGNVGQQVGSAMRERGEKVKKLFFRASSGVVDWGRQLAGRTAKSAAASSTSGSLAPLTGMRS